MSEHETKKCSPPPPLHPSTTNAIHEKQSRLLRGWVERPQWSRMRQRSHNPNREPRPRRTTVEPNGRACRSPGAAADSIIIKRIISKTSRCCRCCCCIQNKYTVHNTIMLRVTPIYGSRWQSSTPQGTCTLVEYANVKVLVNVGSGSGSRIKGSTGTCWPDHDVLVVSDSTLECIGSLPLYCTAFPHTQILVTFPTAKMGQMTLWDYHAQLSLDGGSPSYTLEQIDQAMNRLQTIKYSQSIHIKGQLSITAQRAGHVVGGAVWILKRLQDETSVLVTSTYSIAKEHHLDSSTLLKYGATPDVLITRPGGPALPLAHVVKPTTVSETQSRLLESIMSVLRRDGNVLLPVDASGRALELILLLHQYWEKQRLSGTYPLVWIGPMVGNTLEYAKSQLEWMHDKLGTQFLDTNNNPFTLPQVTLLTHVDQLTELVSAGKNVCVVASGLSLDHGPARDLFLQWADNENHAVLFTDSAQCWDRDLSQISTTDNNTTNATTTTTTTTSGTSSSTVLPESVLVVEDAETDATANPTGGRLLNRALTSPYTTSYQLLQYWCTAQRQGAEMDDHVEVDVLVPRRAPLMGSELQQFMESEEAARRRQREELEQQQMLQQVELAKGRLRLVEDPHDSTTLGGSNSATATKFHNNPNLKYMQTKQTRLDSNLFLKFSKPLHLTFAVSEVTTTMGMIGQPITITSALDSEAAFEEDDYGIAVEPTLFKDIVTGVDPSKYSSGRIGDEVLRRGLGFDLSAAESSTNKKRKIDEEDDNEQVDERGLEAMDLSEGRGIIRGRNGRPPSKVTTEPRRIQVFCEIDYIPLEGRVDARAARQSVRALQPRKVVVLGGTMPPDAPANESLIDAVRILADAAQSFTRAHAVVPCPNDDETAELNVGHAAYSVRLIANPYRPPEEQTVGGEEPPPEPVELHEAKLGACTVSLIDYVATGQKVALDGSLVLAPRSNKRLRNHRPVSIYLSDGEVLLTDLRTDLIAQGMKAEYSTHSGYARLVVNGKVVVKKEQDSGRISVEGPLCEDFFTVRSVVTSQYVTL